MRAFVITLFLTAVAAAPQYNYQQPNGLNNNQRAPSGDLSLIRDAFQSPQLSQVLLGPSLGGQQQQPINFNGGVLQSQFVPQIQHVRQEPQLQLQQQQFNPQAAPLPAIITKDIYVHAAPEDPEERYNTPPPAPLPPRKHYRIVFIKAPTENANRQQLRLVQAPTEEKTIIYVLSKKPEPIDLQSIVQQAAPTPPSKPEVYFIKYKTQEEAAHAQQTIQAQFDALGGPSSVSDEGIAPLTSVIGSLQGGSQQQLGVPGIQQGSSGLLSSGSDLNGNTAGAYLPPSQ